MADFGEALRVERERQGISVAALSDETRVQLRHLEALEQGEFHQLPGGVFRRGIARAYLKALHLEEETWMPRFEASVAEHDRARGEQQVSPEVAWETFASNVKKNRLSQQPGSNLRWAGAGALVLLLLLAAWVLWRFELHRLLTK